MLTPASESTPVVAVKAESAVAGISADVTLITPLSTETVLAFAAASSAKSVSLSIPVIDCFCSSVTSVRALSTASIALVSSVTLSSVPAKSIVLPESTSL